MKMLTFQGTATGRNMTTGIRVCVECDGCSYTHADVSETVNIWFFLSFCNVIFFKCSSLV